MRGNFVDNQNSGVTDIYSYQEYQAAARGPNIWISVTYI